MTGTTREVKKLIQEIEALRKDQEEKEHTLKENSEA